jgi:hypothetical protein
MSAKPSSERRGDLRAEQPSSDDENQVGCPSSDHAAGDPVLTAQRRLGPSTNKSAPTLDRAIGVAPPDAPVLMAVFVVAGGLGMGSRSHWCRLSWSGCSTGFGRSWMWLG